MKNLLTFVLLVFYAYVSSGSSQDTGTTVAGVRFDRLAIVGGSSLTLNGAGVRTKSGFKVYAAGLYLAEPKRTSAELLLSSGAKRLVIVMLRDVSTEDLGSSFMTAFSSNTTREERVKLLSYSSQFTKNFEFKAILNKGDVVKVDWVPGVGMNCFLNDEIVGETIGDSMFYQAVLKVWTGNRAVESALRTELLRGPISFTDEKRR